MKCVRKWWDWFLGHRVYSATAGSNIGHVWKITDTSSAGTPTYAPVAGARGVKVDMDTQAEVQNVCLNWADNLCVDIDDLLEARFRIKMNQAALTSGSSLACGLQSARNDAIDSITAHASIRVIGADSTTAVVVETDDGTTDKDDIATGQTLINVAKDFVISFANGKNDVRFFIDGQPVALATTFDMSAYTAGLQPYVQLQKTLSANADGFTLEAVELTFRE